MQLELEPSEVDMLARLVRKEIDDLELCIINGGDDSVGNLRLSVYGLEATLKKLEASLAGTKT